MEIASIVKKFIGLAQRQFAGKPVTAPEVRMLNKEFYQGLKLQVSFSKMQDTEVAWLAFLAEGQSVRRGIFPLLLYFKELNALLLAFGQSETYPPDQPW